MTARANEWKYVPVRRLGVYDEQCLEGSRELVERIGGVRAER